MMQRNEQYLLDLLLFAEGNEKLLGKTHSKDNKEAESEVRIFFFNYFYF